MKSMTFFLLIFIFAFSTSHAADDCNKKLSDLEKHFKCLENVNLDIHDGDIILASKKDNDKKVEITEDYELYVNGEFIETNKSQRRLVRKYHNRIIDIVDLAKEIGIEGAQIGLKGAKVGLVAIFGIIKLLDSDYNTDDLEQDIEQETEKIEEKAGALKELADELQELAENFEKVHYQLKDNIPALQELEWF